MKKVLIVDDSEFMRCILKDIITKQNPGFSRRPIEVVEADSKETALKNTREWQPDAILLDIVMKNSEVEGIEFLETVKGTFNLNKVIMITSVGQPHVINRCKKLGINYILQKPFEYMSIINSLNRVL